MGFFPTPTVSLVFFSPLLYAASICSSVLGLFLMSVVSPCGGSSLVQCSYSLHCCYPDSSCAACKQWEADVVALAFYEIKEDTLPGVVQFTCSEKIGFETVEFLLWLITADVNGSIHGLLWQTCQVWDMQNSTEPLQNVQDWCIHWLIVIHRSWAYCFRDKSSTGIFLFDMFCFIFASITQTWTFSHVKS